MNDFQIGFAFGSLIIGLISTPFLVYFGAHFFHLRNMEKQIIKETQKEIPDIVDPEVKKTLDEAKKIIEGLKNVNQS